MIRAPLSASIRNGRLFMSWLIGVSMYPGASVVTVIGSPWVSARTDSIYTPSPALAAL